MVQSPSRKAHSRSARQDIPHLLWNQKDVEGGGHNAIVVRYKVVAPHFVGRTEENQERGC